MIELCNDCLRFSFPDLHEAAGLTIDFQRTLRIPDDDRTYPLPPGLGSFPVRHVDDFADHLPASWKTRGGVMLPMYQSEALWINFSRGRGGFGEGPDYPFAIKIAAGKINAINGEPWTSSLDFDDQNYAVWPKQPWLDGFAIEKGTIRQFVAMPLGSGYSAEEQITGEAEWGGLQIEVYPLKADAYERLVAERERRRKVAFKLGSPMPRMLYSMKPSPDMSLAPGGRMRQEIYDDPYSPDDWDLEHGVRCFVHLANSLVWRQITGSGPPHTPFTATEYEAAGLPWFDYYDDAPALEGSETLAGLTSVAAFGKVKGDVPLPDNSPVDAADTKEIGPKRRGDLVRVGRW